MPHPTATASIRYPDRLRLRAPLGLLDAIEVAAERRHTSSAEWARQALLRCLEADGVKLRDGRVETRAA